ncbi:MAG: metal-independent alpha-mannosidase [Haloplasmataceae bacterium]|jgi:meiotically up-regulated gene 157 (Mug157) protein|nr:metal-independent alpha-mannosidase [Haloplasmataceae bacterium]
MKYANMNKKVLEITNKIKDEKLKVMFQKCFYNTLETTVETMDDESVYVITGDISAMWLRDSSAQVIQYLDFINEDDDVKILIKGVLKRQFSYIKKDPYANAFNREPNNFGHKGDETEHNPWVWERKFELDSLAYPIFLAYKYYSKTKDMSIFNNEFVEAVKIIINLFKIEQHHEEQSKYYHFRPHEVPELSVPSRGKGGKCAYTGMIWSGYRPSDDPCQFGYFIPGNMFVVVVLKYLEEIFTTILSNHEFVSEIKTLRDEVEKGINQYGIVDHEKYGKMYAFETDGLGNYNLMDDANVPSLLSLPYLNYLSNDDLIYQNTRNFVLSNDNPFYYEGKVLKGIGSPHTPKDYIWHISIIMQGLTTSNHCEILEMIELLKASDANTDFMHEGVNKDNPSEYTRPWFAWANSLFSYFIIKNLNLLS